MKRTKSALFLTLVAALVAASFGCTKGRHVGGTDDNPAAIDTGGVPDLPKEGEHETKGSGQHGETKVEPVSAEKH